MEQRGLKRGRTNCALSCIGSIAMVLQITIKRNFIPWSMYKTGFWLIICTQITGSVYPASVSVKFPTSYIWGKRRPFWPWPSCYERNLISTYISIILGHIKQVWPTFYFQGRFSCRCKLSEALIFTWLNWSTILYHCINGNNTHIYYTMDIFLTVVATRPLRFRNSK